MGRRVPFVCLRSSFVVRERVQSTDWQISWRKFCSSLSKIQGTVCVCLSTTLPWRDYVKGGNLWPRPRMSTIEPWVGRQATWIRDVIEGGRVARFGLAEWQCSN